MFRKVQLKFFGIITSILIAIFIGVLGSINIIMDALMERQTKVVLQQVASGVEYNDQNSTFSYVDPNRHQYEPPKKIDPPVSEFTLQTQAPTDLPETNETKQSETTAKTKATETVNTDSKQTSSASEKESSQTKTATTAAKKSTAKTQSVKTSARTEIVKRTETTAVVKTTAAQKTVAAIHTNPPQTAAVTKAVEATKRTESPKTTEQPKRTEALKTTAQPKQTENPKPTEPPKKSEAPKDSKPPKHSEAVKPTEAPPENHEPNDDNSHNAPDGEFNPWNDPWNNPGSNPWAYPWFNPWDNPFDNSFDYNDSEKENNGSANSDRRSFDNEGIKPTANFKYVPVLDGYTIEINGRAVENKPPEMPDNSFGHDHPGNAVPKSLSSIDFFIIMADSNGKYTASMNNDDLTEEEAQGYIDNIMNKNDNIGMTGNLSFCVEPKSNGTLIVLSDRTSEMAMMKKLKRTTLIVGIISIILLSAAGYFLSGLIVRPIKDTFEKQKQFISDASHELKTPLTVISTNADVLSGEIGDNKWLNYIHDQADRMNVLVNDLLSLTRLENSSREFITTEFDLSRAVMNASLPFECQAFENRKNFVLNIEEGISITGSEQHIKQMTGIFIDNALKYSKDGGTVRVSLTREENKAVLSVYNTGSGVREEEVGKLFERFYRSDESRNRSTGGYGLGLAIAKSIIDKHKFTIQVENQEGRSICFVVTMQ